jgi:N-acetylglucosaminyldiphosphoundecaprenol N-acetyl-beta-D-mannosaminyltransferase
MKFFDIKFDAIKKKDASAKLDIFFDKSTPSLITTTNVELLMLSRIDEEFKSILNKSALNSVDGAGIIWGYGLTKSWRPEIIILKQLYVFFHWLFSLIFLPFSLLFFKKYIPEKISGADFIWDLAKYAAKNNKSIFLFGYKLGLDPNVVEKTSLKLQTSIYDLKIAGAHSGTESIAEEKEICSLIKKSDADILMLGLGSPRQEKWLSRNLKKTGAKIGIGLGATFDFIAGAQKRAPRFIQKIGLEWFWRLLSNPRRLKRQISTLPKFALLVLWQRMK